METELDRLYQGPLREFVSARNALAASLRSSGEPDKAKRVKALAKPSASAWAVNQLYWRERAIFDALIAAGDRYRAALQKGHTEAAERERREAVERALAATRALLDEGGHKLGETLLRRITTTLEALASYGSDHPEPMRGRLTEDLEPPGFGAFAGLSPSAPSSVEPTPDPVIDVITERQAAVDRAKETLTLATERVHALTEKLESLQRRLLQAHQAAEDAAVRVTEKEALLEEAKRKAHR